MSRLDPLIRPHSSSQVYWEGITVFQKVSDRYDSWVLFAVVEGRFRYRIGTASGEAAFGDVVLCPPGMLFEREVLEPLSFHFYRFDWQPSHSAAGMGAGGCQTRRNEKSSHSMRDDTEEDSSLTEAAKETTVVDTQGPEGGHTPVPAQDWQDEPPAAAWHGPEGSVPSRSGWQASAPPVSEDERAAAGLPGPGKRTIRDLERLASNYAYLNQLQERGAGQRGHALAAHLLCDLWQLCCLSDGAASDAHRRRPGSAMREAAQLLGEGASRPLAVKEVALRLGLTAVQLTRRFREAYDRTPLDYLTGLRVQRAQSLLLRSELTLDEIAQQCGYESGFYLSRLFAKRLGISPSDYRRMHRI
ncbi:helix-turn-helix transcriptional regulator [Paenibacillus sp. IB182496]|uniref:Helix-turn-helix transcriptional regulator n=1 Tax=Paenibacillus sabuli TaxID=2772509 RepID=A0A927GQ59_9BACL|nr:AraC family transcriptional regulator [Paenibacillus sabuli]MBD2844184.1 helix-turn-helix transcriptional regulator [Paenibacillus sabuli]